jgi:hypothetical protein
MEARSGKDRRSSSPVPPMQRAPAKLQGAKRFNWVTIAVVLVSCAALVAGLILLGTVTNPVNPVKVKIRP